MKKLILCLFFILCFLEAPHSHATSVQGYFETYCFKGLDDSSYVETSVNVLASTLTYKPGSDKKFTALMEITIAYMQDSTVKKYFKYLFNKVNKIKKEKTRKNCR